MENLQTRFSGSEKPEMVHQINRVTWVGFAVNLGLSILKFLAGYFGSSQAVIADAVHSLSDMSTDVAILLGVKYWTAPADEKHPYGHHRIETMITVFIGLALLAVAVGLAYNAIVTIRDDDARQPGVIALVAAVISIFSKEILFRWTIKIGQQVKSTAVVANAWHHRSDALSSIPAAIAVAVALVYPNLAFVDHIGALVVSVFILIVAWNITSQALNVLADRGAAQKETEEIYGIAMRVEHVQAVHAIRTRQLGSSLHVDLHVKVDPNMSVKAGHDVSEIVKHELIARGPNVIDVVVHLEPFEGKISTRSDLA